MVTIDHFLGKQQSQGGAADNFIFCNQPGEVQGNVYHIWQFPDDKRNMVTVLMVLYYRLYFNLSIHSQWLRQKIEQSILNN